MTSLKNRGMLVALLITFTIAGSVPLNLVYASVSIDTVTPGGGYKGDTIVVTGSGVPAGNQVKVYWDTVTAWDGEKGLLNITEADEIGTFEAWFDVPQAKNGVHYIRVKDAETGQTDYASFTVQAKIVLTPSSGLPLDRITMRGYGFSSQTQITTITFEEMDLTTSPYIPETDSLGSWTATFDVPDNPFGTYTIYAEDDFSVSAATGFMIGPYITLNIEEGPVGTVVEISGRGFTDGASIETGRVMLDDTLCFVTNEDTVENGEFNVEAVIPSVNEEDEYEITVDDGVWSADATFEITGLTEIEVDPDFGPQGSRIEIHGYNFAKISGEEVSLELWNEAGAVFLTDIEIYETDSMGRFSGYFTVPARSSDDYTLMARQEGHGATDDYNIHGDISFRIGMMIVILNPSEGPPGTEVTLAGTGFTENGEWTAKLDDIVVIEDGDVNSDGNLVLYGELPTFLVPILSVGTYTLEVSDISDPNNIIKVVTEFTVTSPPPLYLSLHIEDAPEGVMVHKVTGDLDGPTHYTRVEIVAKLISYSSQTINDIPVVLTISGDLFGSPINTWVRDTDGGDLVSVSADTLGGGQYRVITDLSQIDSLYRKQIVWRFLIPNNLSPQDVMVNAQIQIPCEDPQGTGTIRIMAPGNTRALYITNRKILYDNYIEEDVTALLQRLFTEAQGHPHSHSPQAVIYYSERYDTRALNWDNNNVDYTSEATANNAANAIDELIEDWVDDATQYELVCFPLNCIEYPLHRPDFLLIVGDDDVIPFYRYDDPSDDEGINPMPPCFRNGWCVDSTPPPNVNPAVWATDNDCILTDNIYADLGGGTDWQTGDIELYIGRLLGETADDMIGLLEEGTSWNNGDMGGVVMASVDGWELGLEPDDGRVGEIADLYDVTDLFRSKGFLVRNDDDPTSEVRTIDVMAPYEGGDNSWNTNFRNAANDAGGLDIFFIGGHDSYDHASIPGDDFSPDDTPVDYTRFGVDHPIAIISGCHGGLPVRDGGGLNGGADNDMVFDLVHEGASAYIGATGFSYGSPGNLHVCTWAERLIQEFFHQLLKPSGGNSMALGAALSKAKNNYVYGYGNNNEYDNKTMTEFNLYGVPWTFVYYPDRLRIARALLTVEEIEARAQMQSVVQVAKDVYSRTIDLTIDTYDLMTLTQDDIDYDLFIVEDGDIAIADDAPILPYLEGYSMTLPFGGAVTGVKVVDSISQSIGKYNVPIAKVEPFTAEGLKYTKETDIDYLYPIDDELVRYQVTNDGLLFTMFPIQHNPTTDETLFYSQFEIEITYESPITVVVSEFSTEKEMYVIGEVVNTHSRIENVGTQNVTLTAELTIQDSLGRVIGTPASSEFMVESGSSYDLPLSWSGLVDNMDYTVQIRVYSEGTFVGGSSTWISVSSGEIMDLSAPKQLLLGEEGNFEVTFVNYDDDPLTGQITLSIQDIDGISVEEVTQQDITLTGSSTETTTFTWTPIDVSPGRYNAFATAVFDGRSEAVQSFCVLFDTEDLNSKLEEANAKISSLEEELREKENELADSQEKIDELESIVTELRITINGLQKWRTYTYVVIAIAILLLMILLFILFRK